MLLAAIPALAYSQWTALEATLWKQNDSARKEPRIVRLAGVSESSLKQVRLRARVEVQAWLSYVSDVDLKPLFRGPDGREAVVPSHTSSSGDNAFRETNTWTVVPTLLRKGLLKLSGPDLQKMPFELAAIYVRAQTEAKAYRAGMWRHDSSKRAITVSEALRWQLWDPIKKTQRTIRIYGLSESSRVHFRREARHFAERWVDQQSEGDVLFEVRTTDIDFVDAVNPWGMITSLTLETQESSFGLELLRLGLCKLNPAEPNLPAWLADEAKSSEADARRHRRGIWQ